MRLLTILGSKGGVGKSTLASNLLVAAELTRVDVVGVDLDHQGSLGVWAAKRRAAGIQPDVRTITGHLTNWRNALALGKPELMVADTPPGLPDEDHRAAARELALASQLVLIPALAEGPTLEMLGEVGGSLRDMGAPVVFVLNKVDPRRRATRAARGYLSAFCEVCEVEIQAREHVHQAMHEGLAVAEDRRLGASEQMLALWEFVAQRLELR
jgi:chromosome partitioning protein